MTEGQTMSLRTGALRRRLSWFSLLAVLMTLFVSALPGVASAAPRVVPQMDCYAQNNGGTYTLVLGYQSSNWRTETIAQGSNNYTTPSTYTSQLPTTFARGEHHGVASLTVSKSDFDSRRGVTWYLDGTSVTYSSTSRNAVLCDSAQLPAYANGGALVVILLVAGAAGVLMVRRARRSASIAEPTS